MSDDKSELISLLRHLVSLNDPERGGPYQGYAAAECIRAMREAADALEDPDYWERRQALKRKRPPPTEADEGQL